MGWFYCLNELKENHFHKTKRRNFTRTAFFSSFFYLYESFFVVGLKWWFSSIDNVYTAIIISHAKCVVKVDVIEKLSCKYIFRVWIESSRSKYKLIFVQVNEAELLFLHEFLFIKTERTIRRHIWNIHKLTVEKRSIFIE